MTQGQPGFFTPRQPNPWFSLTGAKTATSYYDSAPLRETLNELVDFDLINERIMRFSVGATNVLTGNFIYFDNHDEEIGPEHVMASGALPPALPMIKTARIISGMAASCLTRRYSTCSTRRTGRTCSSSTSTCSARAASFRAISRT
jgi:predicted acylesterase/phospholipase RssA